MSREDPHPASKVVNIQSNQSGAAVARVLPFLTAASAEPDLNPDYLVKGLVHPGNICIAYGKSGTYKTFAVLDMAARIALGLEWHTRRTKPARILYVSGEGGEADASNRLAALRAKFPGLDDRLAVITVPSALDRLDELEAVRNTSKQAFGEKRVRLIVWDTLSTSLASTNEYHNGEAAQALATLRRFSASVGNPAILLVHHTGHEAVRERGASAWRANADVSIEFTFDKDRGIGEITAQKVRHGPTGVIGGFQPNVVELGTDVDGDVVTSISLSDVAASEMHERNEGPKLSDTHQAILNEILAEVGRGGRMERPYPDGPMSKVIDRSHLNDALRRAGIIGDPPENDGGSPPPLSAADRSKVRDALTKLNSLQLVGRTDRYVWLV